MTPRKQPERTDRDRLTALLSTLEDALATAREAPADKQGQVAPLAKQYRDTLAAIAKLPVAQRSARDEIAAKRAARLAGADAPARAGGKVVSGTGRSRAGGKRGADPGPVAAARPRRRAGGSA